METRKVEEIIWREDLYPRFEPDASRIQQYAEVIEVLPPIEINQRNELIDGYHRWTAHKKAELETIQVTVTETKSDAELERLMVRRNASFGIQLTSKEKERKAVKWFDSLAVDKAGIAADLAVDERTVSRWVARKSKDLKDEREKKIAEMWLACYTEEEIAEAVGMPQQTVNDHLKDLPKSDIWQKSVNLSHYGEEDWTPPLYDVWKQQTKSNKTGHFGNSEANWLDNLLYMYTEPFDIIVDPFAGGGSTIDVCKRRLRRYWVSDRKPIVERRDIRKWDILEGPPPLYNRWGDVQLLFLDPPYWKQAEGKYSKDLEDLANMDLEMFYANLTGFVSECGKRMAAGSKIAMLMQPTQWRAPDKKVIDHVVDLIMRVPPEILHYERRIVVPYESQQCSAQQVEWAKANRDVLVISRELIIWKRI